MKKWGCVCLLIFSINIVVKSEDVEFKTGQVNLFRSMTKTELKTVDTNGENQSNQINKLRSGEKITDKTSTKNTTSEVTPKKDEILKNEIAKKEISVSKNIMTTKTNPKTGIISDKEIIIGNTQISTTNSNIVPEIKRLPTEILRVSYQDEELNSIQKAKVIITARNNIIYIFDSKKTTSDEQKYGVKENIITFDKKKYTKPVFIKEHLLISGKSYSKQNLVKDKRGAGYEIKFGNFFDKSYY